MKILVSFSNVNLFGSCALLAFDLCTGYYAWPEKLEFLDISSIIRVVPLDRRLLILYRNSSGAKRLASLASDLTVENVTYNIEIDGINDIFPSGNGRALAVSDDQLFDIVVGKFGIEVMCGEVLAFPGATVVSGGFFRGAEVFAVQRRTSVDKGFVDKTTLYSRGEGQWVERVGAEWISDLNVVDDALVLGDAMSPSLVVVSSVEKRISFARGYVKGLCKLQQHYVVGLSAWRHQVRRHGKRKHPDWVTRSDLYKSYSTQLAIVDPEQLSIIGMYEFSHLGREVSSIVPFHESDQIELSGRTSCAAAARRLLLLEEREAKEHSLGIDAEEDSSD